MKRDLTVVGAPILTPMQKATASISPTALSLNTMPANSVPAPLSTEVISPTDVNIPPPAVTNWFSTPFAGPITNGEAAIGAGLFVAILIGVAVSR